MTSMGLGENTGKEHEIKEKKGSKSAWGKVSKFNCFFYNMNHQRLTTGKEYDLHQERLIKKAKRYALTIAF